MAALVGVQVLNYLLPMITIPIVVRIIGPTKLGIINYVSAIVSYFVLFIGFNFELSATRLIALNPDDHAIMNLTFNKAFFSKLILFFASALMFILLFGFLPDLKKNTLIAFYTFLLSFATVFDTNFLFAAKQDLKQTAMFNLVTKVLMNISLLLFIRKQADYIYQPLIVSLSQIIVMVSAFFMAIFKYKLKIFFPGIKPVMQMLWTGRSLFLHALAHTIYTTINIVILGSMAGVTAVGYYTAGWKLIILIQALLISPLGTVLFPIVGKAFSKSNEEGVSIIQKALPLILLITLMIALIILIFGGLIIHIFYGKNFQDSALIFKLLAFTPMFLALNMLFGVQAMVNLKMDKSFVKITITAAIFNVISSLVLIHYWNAAGAAISWFCTEMLCAISMLLVLIKNGVLLYNQEYFSLDLLKSQVVLSISRVKGNLKKPGI